MEVSLCSDIWCAWWTQMLQGPVILDQSRNNLIKQHCLRDMKARPGSTTTTTTIVVSGSAECQRLKTEFTVATDQVPGALSPVPCCTQSLHRADVGLVRPGSHGACFSSSTYQLFELPAVSCPSYESDQSNQTWWEGVVELRWPDVKKIKHRHHPLIEVGEMWSSSVLLCRSLSGNMSRV